MTQFGAYSMSGTALRARFASGSGEEEELLAVKDDHGLPISVSWPQWSSDGRYLVYMQQSGPTGTSIWAVPTAGGGKPQLIVKPESAAGRVTFFHISPDSHWLAYSSYDGGREEIYVTSFPSGNGRWQISREGGTFPVWRHDSREIYFVGYAIQLMAADVRPLADGFEVGGSQSLFEVRNVLAVGAPFDVSPDGKRFLVLTQPSMSPSPMMLVLNWTSDLGK